MAYRITNYIVDPGDNQVHIEHRIYGKDRAEAERMREHHLGACAYFRAAEAAGMTDEYKEEIPDSEWPKAEEEGTRTIDMEPDDR